MELTLLLLSWFAIASTIGLFLTGIGITRRISSARNSDGVSFVPFLSTSVNCILWLKYGLLTGDTTVITVNGTGAILNVYYTAMFYAFTPDKRQIHTAMAFAVLVLYGILVYVKYLITDYETAVEDLGVVCCVFTVVMFGSPLASVSKVIQQGSTESMEFSMCAMNFVVAVTWTLYGFLVHDLYIQTPNSLGALLALFELMLFVRYPDNGKKRPVFDLSNIVAV